VQGSAEKIFKVKSKVRVVYVSLLIREWRWHTFQRCGVEAHLLGARRFVL